MKLKDLVEQFGEDVEVTVAILPPRVGRIFDEKYDGLHAKMNGNALQLTQVITKDEFTDWHNDCFT